MFCFFQGLALASGRRCCNSLGQQQKSGVYGFDFEAKPSESTESPQPPLLYFAFYSSPHSLETSVELLSLGRYTFQQSGKVPSK